MSVTKELVARLMKAQKRLDALETRERPLALRGWRDDFLGDAIHEQYTAVSNGAGSGGALQNNAHGGVYRLTAGAAAGRYHFLILGDAVDGYATLDADAGWTMIARVAMSSTADSLSLMGSGNSTGTRQLFCGYRSDVVANNWLLRCIDGGGTTNIDTEVAADTDWHWWRFMVYPTITGRRADFFLDGELIGSCANNVPADVLTPYFQQMTRGGVASKYANLDYWGVIPMNLA